MLLCHPYILFGEVSEFLKMFNWFLKNYYYQILRVIYMVLFWTSFLYKS